MTDPDQPPAPPPATNTQARALASPLRLRILRLCLDTPLTNQQIATALFVSRRTVESHLVHIFRKLGIRTRTQLAAMQFRAQSGNDEGEAPSRYS